MHSPTCKGTEESGRVLQRGDSERASPFEDYFDFSRRCLHAPTLAGFSSAFVLTAPTAVKNRFKYYPRSSDTIRKFVIREDGSPSTICRAKLQFPVNSATLAVTLLSQRLLTGLRETRAEGGEAESREEREKNGDDELSKRGGRRRSVDTSPPKKKVYARAFALSRLPVPRRTSSPSEEENSRSSRTRVYNSVTYAS